MFRHRLSLRFVVTFTLFLALAVACGGNGGNETPMPSENQPPTVVINSPSDGTLLEPGQAVQVNVVANDDQAVARVELYVDNSLIESRVAPSGSALTTTSEQFTWSASMMGPHTLQVRAYDATGQMGASRFVAVEVRLPGEATSPPVSSPPPGATSPPDGATSTPLTPTEPASTATPESALVTANVNANVRGGPGTNYNVVGVLRVGESAPVTGRNSDSSWWQINYQGGASWIANSVVTASSTAHDAPVVSAPPPPPTNTPAPPTATPPPTVTAGPSATPIPTTGFRADQTSFSVGQCTTLRWDFDNISAVFVTFGFGYSEDGQPGHGTRQVCPSVTTIYKARVIKQDQSQETHEVTVAVSGGGCGDPYVTQFAPTTHEVAAGTPFSVFWQVDCAKSVRYIKGDGPEQSVMNSGSKIDETITADTIFKLKVEKNDGGIVFASFVVKVK